MFVEWLGAGLGVREGGEVRRLPEGGAVCWYRKGRGCFVSPAFIVTPVCSYFFLCGNSLSVRFLIGTHRRK